MTTYNSYEEAKIANPREEILKARDDWDGCKSYVGKFTANKSDENGGTPLIGKGAWELCNPSDCCMTYNQCDEFSVGMIVLERGVVRELNVVSASILNTAKSDPIQRESWDSHLILRAAALKPRDNDYAMSVMEKKVKVEYVQEGSFKEVLKCAIDGEVFYSKDGKGEFKFDVPRMSFVNHDGVDMKISNLTYHEFYRRIETEIDERKEFIKAYSILREKFMIQREYEYFDDFMADSGKFKLVDGE
ncbi:hypothetical protein NVP1016O_06 [Vibrio phage 1.016.O._10N.286.46.A11]|nr:hypothetical protein NVP1016O_06 [Vibrio phage 1.016.O._10N.286.46.A11]AUR85236.1 hypothetical protein NVP1071A_06 [Vibrio phage 1.071.A._10N.286.46.A12]